MARSSNCWHLRLVAFIPAATTCYRLTALVFGAFRPSNVVEFFFIRRCFTAFKKQLWSRQLRFSYLQKYDYEIGRSSSFVQTKPEYICQVLILLSGETPGYSERDRSVYLAVERRYSGWGSLRFVSLRTAEDDAGDADGCGVTTRCPWTRVDCCQADAVDRPGGASALHEHRPTSPWTQSAAWSVARHRASTRTEFRGRLRPAADRALDVEWQVPRAACPATSWPFAIDSSHYTANRDRRVRVVSSWLGRACLVTSWPLADSCETSTVYRRPVTTPTPCRSPQRSATSYTAPLTWTPETQQGPGQSNLARAGICWMV